MKFGPYYLYHIDGRWTIDELRNNVARLNTKEGNAAKTDIRQWLTVMNDDTAYADQMERRVKAVASDDNYEIFHLATEGQERGKIRVYPAFDMLQLLTVENQITKEGKDEKH